MTRWNTTYTDIAHASEEVISDTVRKAYFVLAIALFAGLVTLFWYEQQQSPPSISHFAGNAIALVIGVFFLYLALVELRRFAHRQPHAWHALTWSSLWLFVLGGTAYFLWYEGPSDTVFIGLLALFCLYLYRWLMHRARFSWVITPQGVSQTINVMGHKQTFTTRWNEVRTHRVHPLTGAVELTLRRHHFRLAPRVHLIVPGSHRRDVHKALHTVFHKNA